MTTTCLINNYNYAHFIGHAIDSALGQSVPFDEIIVVDDGSTDGSLELLASRYARHPAIKIIAQKNQGQLSCFNEGFARATGDIVFFLDADDIYEPDYHGQALEVYGRNQEFDFVFCGCRQFGETDSVKLKFAEDRDLGYSVILAVYLREWIGGPTSCLSARRRVLEKILPLPFPDVWRTRADDCLVFGSSLVGARKYYLAQPLVRYRVHRHNQFCGLPPDKFAIYRRRLAINRLFEYLERKLCYNMLKLAEFHHREFCTIAKPTFRQLRQYLHINLTSRASIFRRLACVTEMTSHFLRTAMQPVRRERSVASRLAESESPRLLHLFVPTASEDNMATMEPREHRRRAA